MEELTNFERWQLERYGNILPSPGVRFSGEEFENRNEQIEREAEWVEMQAERQQIKDVFYND
jgi:hypothetical protein